MAGELSTVGSADLEAAPNTLEAPFTLDIAGRKFAVTRVLRWLPGKRLTALVEPGGVLKLFIGTRAVARMARERAGLDAFSRCGLATPAVLERGASWLLFEHLRNAEHATDVVLPSLAAGLAALHAAGFLHGDLHLGNFLQHHGVVHFIDGDSVVQRPVSEDAGLTELAVLLAQFPAAAGDLTRQALAAYATVRPVQADAGALAARVQTARRKRIDHYLAKSRRTCTEFEVVPGDGCRLACRRQQMALGRRLLSGLDAAFGGDARFLKQGRSATVVRVFFDGQPYIIKRYNVKGLMHRLRRIFKRRARRAWEAALTLEFLGIPTARPVALLETGPALWPGPAYLLFEDLGDEDLAALTADGAIDDATADAVVWLLRLLRRVGIVHGDMKSTNFLVHGAGFALIDVDGLARDGGDASRDVARLLANWPEGSPVREKVRAAIVRAPELEALVR